MTGVGPCPLNRGRLVCNWELEGPLRFQRDWAWVVGAWHRRCGGKTPALPPDAHTPWASLPTCEGEMSVSALPCSLAGRLCVRTRSHQVRESPSIRKAHEKAGVCTVLRPTKTQGCGRARRAGRRGQSGPSLQGCRARSTGAGGEGRGDSPCTPSAWPARPRPATPAPCPQPPGPSWAGLPAVCQRPDDW